MLVLRMPAVMKERGKMVSRLEGNIVLVCLLCSDNYQLSSLPALQHRHRLGQTEPRWGSNTLKDKPEEDKSQQSDLSGEVIVGRLTVVFDDKNKCEKIETKQTVTSPGQLRSDPPFPSSIRSLTLSPSQKQNR